MGEMDKSRELYSKKGDKNSLGTHYFLIAENRVFASFDRILDTKK